MSDYAIGDVQGCYEPLQRLLEHIHFNERTDRLWFVGDLVNRGPDSLAVLRFINSLPVPARITLGNHDLHLLARIFTKSSRSNADDTLADILMAPDCEELGHWLRKQSILYHDLKFNVVMCHAGIAPSWDLATAKHCALELETMLSGDDYLHYLENMYGNEPSYWSSTLTGIARLRVITNFFTRMRFCDSQGHLMLTYKGTIEAAPADLIPWFDVPNRKPIDTDIVFGHWAAIQGVCKYSNIFPIDTGCLWGGRLSALRLQDRMIFSVGGMK